MKVLIDFRQKDGHIYITCDLPDSEDWQLFNRIFSDYIPDSYLYMPRGTMHFPWRYFLMLRNEIGYFLRQHQIETSFTDSTKKLLEFSTLMSYNSSFNKPSIDLKEIEDKLESIGFIRQLTDNQKINLRKIINLPSGATFSVPGAGKTTEALAFFFFNASYNDKLLVVAPKNAFSAWDDQLKACMPSEMEPFTRLRGGEQAIRKLLSKKPKFMIITYQQFPRVKNLIIHTLVSNNTFMFLDESHRIKSGKTGVTAEAVLDVSYLPARKLIMSGTPMPQSIKDLIPQFSFLYPEKKITEDDAIILFQPIFVRTTKGQLDIPEVEHRLISLPMDDLQREIYNTLKSELKRQLNPALNDESKYMLRKIGKCTMKLMQFVSNPALLANDMDYAFNQRLGKLLLKNNGTKIEYACWRARQLAKDKKKVIIWSSFVENVELITERLKDLGADYIHGGVDAGDEDELDTREGKIKRFHDDPHCMVLVANPAAASEGISLHTVCQYAIYVDRSFNAAHYLQSEDRIHRLGLTKEQKPIVEIIECENSIDEVVRQRLKVKVDRMSIALNDPSLNVDVIPYDFEEYTDETNVITTEDAKAVLEYFFGGDKT